jgi:hypothetical protein
VEKSVNQAQSVRQKWTFGEMQAIYNAFRIFAAAHEKFSLFDATLHNLLPNIGFEYDYRWPLEDRITIEKREFAAWKGANLSGYNVADPADAANPIGIHYYAGGTPATTRLIVMSASRWGSTNPKMTDQSRSWLVLHEFSHIFSRDRLTSRCGSYESADENCSISNLPPHEYPGGLTLMRLAALLNTPPMGHQGVHPTPLGRNTIQKL